MLVFGMLHQSLHRGRQFEGDRQADMLRIAQQSLCETQL